jgi:hypothetical protein
MKDRKIKINFDNKESIRIAENMKTALENRGYILKSTIQEGINKFVLTYTKDYIRSKNYKFKEAMS